MKYLIIISFLFKTCVYQDIYKPKLLNEQILLRPYNDTIFFHTPFKSWQVHIYGSIQPIPFVSSHIANLLTIVPKYSLSIPSSFLHVILSSGDEVHLFRFLYENNLQSVSTRKYRSPKSINTDSSLIQYSLEHTITTNRNIIYQPMKKRYFDEYQLMIDPIAGTFIDDINNNRSAFYVQPGSPSSIKLFYTADTLKREYCIQANNLSDAFGNYISDGTLITFYVINKSIYKIYERQVMDGAARIILPMTEMDNTQIKAKIGDLNSSILFIKY